jgi:hypothetical protein
MDYLLNSIFKKVTLRASAIVVRRLFRVIIRGMGSKKDSFAKPAIDEINGKLTDKGKIQ